jgi:hypothetical protein
MASIARNPMIGSRTMSTIKSGAGNVLIGTNTLDDSLLVMP